MGQRHPAFPLHFHYVGLAKAGFKQVALATTKQCSLWQWRCQSQAKPQSTYQASRWVLQACTLFDLAAPEQSNLPEISFISYLTGL